MTEPNVNIPLLRKAVEWAEAEAAKPWELSEWNQSMWAMPASALVRYHDGAKKAPECGTCYCIAGFVSSLHAAEVRADGDCADLLDADGFVIEEDEYAQNALGLTERQANTLFRASNTIEDVRRIAESIAGERL
jgi:hypothetical protein